MPTVVLVVSVAALMLAGCTHLELRGSCEGVTLRDDIDPSNPAHAGSCDADYHFDWPFGHKLAGER